VSMVARGSDGDDDDGEGGGEVTVAVDRLERGTSCRFIHSSI
jgi:hypothetical protein